ncbi:hypothetical protein Xmau_02506 [Xenorhabdus mauleonii]|uniref:Uncharacterized protein n=1 Tax=Xenorhabdus mauleonii TaxID=351675 RepID=A0A1I3RGX1_9GAMM|nr:hypothetical protein [Xenorhabdus mauleonii]PHM39903.1 hypothetical protein Xmau_02506 [Xenorhabdus mauleonii]SFJ45833.1 hypothetical protein SAMN05421680_109141 [Xenorhabdus mauleonii]
MPFLPPFRESFAVGDLIYGLHEYRLKYLNNNPKFIIAKTHYDNNRYPPVFIDQFLTLIDLEHILIIHLYMNNELEDNDCPNTDENKELINIYNENMRQYIYTKTEVRRI